MTEQCVPRVATIYSPQDVYDAMRTGWAELMSGEPCSRSSVLVMQAQSAFETGWWHYCWNSNFGNAKHVAGDGHDYYQVRCNEYVGGQLRWFEPPDPATWFLAFPDLMSGMRDYLVKLRGRFRGAWQYVLAADVPGFCHALKVQGYYTDDEAHYTANVLGCYRRLDAMIPPDPDTIPSPALLASEAASLASPTGATEQDMGEGQS